MCCRSVAWSVQAVRCGKAGQGIQELGEMVFVQGKLFCNGDRGRVRSVAAEGSTDPWDGAGGNISPVPLAPANPCSRFPYRNNVLQVVRILLYCRSRSGNKIACSIQARAVV